MNCSAGWFGVWINMESAESYNAVSINMESGAELYDAVSINVENGNYPKTEIRDFLWASLSSHVYAFILFVRYTAKEM